MEDRWENFWKSGRVEDYLGYCKTNHSFEEGQSALYLGEAKRKDACDYGAVHRVDRNGAERDAAWRV